MPGSGSSETAWHDVLLEVRVRDGDRQGQHEPRPAAGARQRLDRAVHGLHQPLRRGEPQARPRPDRHRRRRAVERLEHGVGLVRLDARPAVEHLEPDRPVVVRPRDDLGGHPVRRIAGHVGEQVAHDLGKRRVVREHGRQVGRDRQADAQAWGGLDLRRDDGREPVLERDRADGQGRGAALVARDGEQVLDEAVEALRLLLDGLDDLDPHGLRDPVPLLAEHLRPEMDRRDRRAELVGQDLDHLHRVGAVRAPARGVLGTTTTATVVAPARAADGRGEDGLVRRSPLRVPAGRRARPALAPRGGIPAILRPCGTRTLDAWEGRGGGERQPGVLVHGPTLRATPAAPGARTGAAVAGV